MPLQDLSMKLCSYVCQKIRDFSHKFVPLPSNLYALSPKSDGEKKKITRS